MRKLFLFIALLISVASFGQNKLAPTFNQPNYYPISGTDYITGQMLNVTNAYTGTLVVDSLAANASVNLAIAYSGSLASPVVPPITSLDTFIYFPLYGYGTLNVDVQCTKISGAPAITGTLWQSPNKVDWYPVRASSTAGQDTFTVTNVSGVQSYSWDKSIKYVPYYYVHLAATSVTQLSSCKAHFGFNKTAQVQK